MYLRAIFALANGLIVIDSFAAPNALQNTWFFVLPVSRQQDEHRHADDLLGRVAEQALRPLIPGNDHTVEILADDGVFGGRDNGREMERSIGNSRPPRPGRHRGGQICLLLVTNFRPAGHPYAV